MTRRYLAFVLADTRRNWKRLAVSSIGVIIGIWAFTLFFAFGIGLDRFLEGQVFPWDKIVVVPARASMDTCPDDDYLDDSGTFGTLLPFAPKTRKFSVITDEVVNIIKQRPEVREAYPKMKASFPATLVGGRHALSLPYELKTVLFIDGIPADEVVHCSSEEARQDMALPSSKRRCEVKAPYSFKDFGKEDSSLPSCRTDTDCPKGTFCAINARPGTSTGHCYHPIPAIISPYLLEIWNGSVAPAHGYPRIDPSSLGNFLGLTVRVYLGSSVFSTMKGSGHPIMRRFQLVGVSDKALDLGVTIPMGYIKRWSRIFKDSGNARPGGTPAHTYSSLVVRVKDKRSISQFLAFIKSMGLSYEESKAETAGLAVTIITAILLFISIVMILIAAINIAHTFYTIVAQRRREIGVLRAIGASRRDIAALFVLEGTILGALSGLLGITLALLTSTGVDWILASAVPDFPFKPDTVFSYPGWLVVLAFSFSVIAAVIAAYLPARAASAVEPSEALSVMV